MTLNSRRFFLIVATFAALTSHAASSVGLAEEDRVLFDSVMTWTKSPSPMNVASARAVILGEQENLAALEYLVASQNFRLVPYFSGGFRRSAKPTQAANAALQKWLAGMFAPDDSIAEALKAVRVVDDPALFELLFADVAQLARWRSDRRKRCTAESLRIESKMAYAPAKPGDRYPRGATAFRQQQLPNYQFLQWRYVCAGSKEDPPNTDLDAKPRVRLPETIHDPPEGPFTYPRERRDLASLSTIARTTIPGVETRLGPLLRDLSLLPNADWTALGGKPDGVVFPPHQAPLELIAFLQERRYRPDTAALLEILAAYEPEAKERLPRTPDNSAITGLLELLALEETREGSESLARWLGHIAAFVDPQMRRYLFSRLLPKLGPVLPPAQADIAALKKTVLGGIPYSEVPEFEPAFKRVEEDNRSLREPSPDSLSRWLARNDRGSRVIPYLLDNGADPNGIPRFGPPPLVAAARGDALDLSALLAHGANVTIRDQSTGETALHAAARRYQGAERPAAVSLLLEHRADVKSTTKTGASPLHYAGDSPQTIKLLLAAGAPVDAVDMTGRTSLLAAVLYGNLESARLLLAAGADPNHPDKSGTSPYFIASERNEAGMVALLASHGGKISAAQQLMRLKGEALAPFAPFVH